MQHHVIGVLGASGGLGVSTLTVALCTRASPGVGMVASVDADFAGGGLDVTACMEHLPGLRWPDLGGARGDLDGSALLQALPRERSVAVLACRGAGQRPDDAVVEAAMTGLGSVSPLTVVDLGRSAALASRCSAVVLVAGTSARQLADADAVAHQLDALPTTATNLALRTGHGREVSAEEVAMHLDLPLGAVVRHDARVLRDAERAAMPGAGRSSVAAAADRLLSQLGLWSQRRVVAPGPGAGLA
jgi:hypothetical protein